MSVVENREDMNIVIVGHVDHGKSTITGRLLADTNSLPEGKLDSVKEMCRRNSKPFEYAFLLDALKDEQAQGITIDSARCFFKTKKRNYIIIDAPGHIEFLKNMVTGAARAEAALLVIDIKEGVQENSRRHGYLLSMLGINQVTVLINKMDLVDYSKEAYNKVVAEYSEFLVKIGVKPKSFIPVAGMFGENIAVNSDKTPWHKGKNILETLDDFETVKLPEETPFRMPVQAVYKFTRDGDNRRIVAGTIDTGKIKIGDEVIFYPSGKKSKVKTIESFNTNTKSIEYAGCSTGFTLEEQIYVRRGELAVIEGEKRPDITTRIRGNLFWLGKQPLVKNKEYLLKVGTAKVRVRIEEIKRVIDASNLNSEKREQVDRNAVAECILKTDTAVAFDLASEIAATGRFVIIDNYEIAGGGIVLEALKDEQSDIREKVLTRNYKWQHTLISHEERAERYSQRPTLILITGETGTGRRDIAKYLEKNLFDSGRVAYYLGIGNILHGVDADIEGHSKSNDTEHLRRLAEISNILLDTGAILIVTAIELDKEDIETIKTVVNVEKIEVVWVGENLTTDISYDIHIPKFDTISEAVLKIKSHIQDKGIIFKAW